MSSIGPVIRSGKGAGPVFSPGAMQGSSTPVFSPQRPQENNPFPTDTQLNIGRHVPEKLDVPGRGADPVGGGALEVPTSGMDCGMDSPATAPTLVPAGGPEDADDGGGGRVPYDASSQAIWSAVKGDDSIPTLCANRSDH